VVDACQQYLQAYKNYLEVWNKNTVKSKKVWIAGISETIGQIVLPSLGTLCRSRPPICREETAYLLINKRRRLVRVLPYQFNPFFGNQSQNGWPASRPAVDYRVGSFCTRTTRRINLALLTGRRRRRPVSRDTRGPDERLQGPFVCPLPICVHKRRTDAVERFVAVLPFTTRYDERLSAATAEISRLLQTAPWRFTSQYSKIKLFI